MTTSEVLGEAFESWRGLAFWKHVAAVVGLAALVLLRWLPWNLSGAPLADERHYFEAFARLLEGRSPMGAGYLYPPALAYGGAFLVARLGEVSALVFLRACNLLGVATAAWGAAAWIPGRLELRWLAAAAFVTSAPAVSFGVRIGNLSLAVAGLLVLGLTIWPRRPLAAGGCLGLSVACKPIAPVALGTLLLHRPARTTQAHRWAAGLGLLLAGTFLFAFPHGEAMWALGLRSLENRSVSIHRIPHVLGLRGYGLWVSLAVALAVAGFVRSRRLGRLQLLAVATAATLAATPLVWGHTLLAALPLQSASLAVAAARGRQGRRRWELTFVFLAVAAILFAQGATGIDDQPVWLQLFGVLPPALAPTLLAVYLLRTTDVV